MTREYYINKLMNGLIFTESHLQRGGQLLSIKETNGTLAVPFIRKEGVSQWSREKRRYMTFEEWEKKQQEAERSSASYLAEEGKGWHAYAYSTAKGGS